MSSVYMMPRVSNETTNVFFALDITTEVSKSQSNALTKSSVMDGSNFSDGYTIGNPSITFTGICNYHKINRNIPGFITPNPREFSVILDKMIASFQRFTLYGNNLIPTLPNVVITSYQINQSKYSESMEVTITVEQVFVSERAQTVRLTKPETATSSDLDVTENSDSGDGSKTELEEGPVSALGALVEFTGLKIKGFND